MKVLVVGGTGYLGSAIVDHFSNFCDVVGCSRSGGITPEGIVIEAVESDDYREFCSQAEVDVVVLALGDGNLDRCESDFSYSYLRNVAHYKQWFNAIQYELPYAKVVLFSSIYVFGESVPLKGYDKTDIPVPISKYGIDKLETERLLNKLTNASLIIRLPWLVGNVTHASDPITRLIGELIAQEKVELDQNVRYPTATCWVAHSTLELIERGIGGIVHLTGEEALSRFQLVHAVASQIVSSLAVKVLDTGGYPNTDKFPMLARRPSGARLAMDDKLALMLAKPPSLSEIVEIYVKGWKRL